MDTITIARKNIKHPFFNYARIDKDGNITYHKKSFLEFFKWFGKKIVLVEPQKIKLDGLADYRR